MSGPGRPGRLCQKRWLWSGWRPGSGGGTGLRRGVDDRREHVVVQVAPDAGQVGDDVDPEAAELVGRADAREQQQLRRLDRAGADDDLALGADPLDRAVPDDLDADAARALEEQPLRVRAGQHGEVRASRRRGARNAVAPVLWRRPSLIVELAERDAVELLAVVVVVERDAGLLRGGDDRRD